MKNNSEFYHEPTRETDQEIIDIELEKRNEKHFKHWARRWYHRYHDLPVKSTIYPVSQ